MALDTRAGAQAPMKTSGVGIALTVLVLALAWYVRGTILLVVTGALVAIILRSTASWLNRFTRLPMTASVWLSFIFTLLALGIGVATGGGALAAQWNQLEPALRNAVDIAARDLSSIPAIATAIQALDPSTLFSNLAPILARAGGIINNAFGFAIAALVIVFVGVAGALEPSLYRNGFVALFPPTVRPRLDGVLDEIVATLQTWLRARALSMTATGLLVWIGLTVLHVPLAGTFGLLAGVLAFIPNIGAFIAGAPAVLIALSISPRLAVAVLVMYWVAHFIDDFLLSPFIERRVVRLPPILTLVAQLVLGVYAGAIGIMLAAPLVAVGLVLVQRLWVDPLES